MSVVVVTASKTPQNDLSRCQGTVTLGAGIRFSLSIPEVFTQQDTMMVVCAVI